MWLCHRVQAHFGQADALSRLIASKKLPEDEDIVIAKIEQDVMGDVIRHLPVTKEDVRRMTEEDPKLELVVEAVNTGWWSKFQAGSTLHAFLSRSADLSVYEGALFMGTRAVIPPALRSWVLKMLHEGHPGATRMKMLAQRHVYWQGINRDIEDRVKLCNACQLGGHNKTAKDQNIEARKTKISNTLYQNIYDYIPKYRRILIQNI